MRIRNAIKIAVAGAMVMLPAGAGAQNSSINTFSPYTFYGIGDISTQGPASLRSMGGIGVAYRDGVSVNFLNPASYSAMPRRNFIFSVGLDGGGDYLKTSTGKTAYNSFNIKDISLQLPLAKGLGLGFVVTPFSSVGYRVEMMETDSAIVGRLGSVEYRHWGEGDLTQVKLGLGWEVAKNLSVGADLEYYMGDIQRYYNTEITPIIATGTFSRTQIRNTQTFSRLMWSAGVQYNLKATDREVLTLGAVWRPGGKMNPRVRTRAFVSHVVSDTLQLTGGLIDNFEMPQTISAGVYYQTRKLGVGMDYEYKGWGGTNSEMENAMVEMVSTNAVRVGFQYTPNRIDVRRYMNRLTYRVGLRYSDYYMKFNGHKMSDKAVTFGMGFPLSMAGMSDLDVGVELGTRGTTADGLVQQRYFKVVVGLSLFSDNDFWFLRRRYN